MQINTALFGPQEIQDDNIITFPQGLPGLENNTRFKVFHEEGKPTVHWLQSVEDEEVCLSVMEPKTLDLAYEFNMSEEQSSLIDMQNEDELLVFVILSKDNATDSEAVPSDSKIKANLTGPIVINSRSRKAFQASLSKAERITLIRAIS